MKIADGHHRYATALNYAKEKGSILNGDKPWDYVMVDLINFNDAGLVILPTHRLINFKLNKDEILEINICFSYLKEFPIEILQYKNLEQLSLNFNEFEYLPEDFGQLTK